MVLTPSVPQNIIVLNRIDIMYGGETADTREVELKTMTDTLLRLFVTVPTGGGTDSQDFSDVAYFDPTPGNTLNITTDASPGLNNTGVINYSYYEVEPVS